jgi:LPXTG-motif cell wall-anchored protein
VSHFSTFALFAELLAVDPAVEPAPPAVDPADPAVDPADPAVEPAPPAVGSADPVVDPADPVVDSIDPAVKPIEYPVARDNKLLFIIIGIFILAGIIFVAIKKRKKDR